MNYETEVTFQGKNLDPEKVERPGVKSESHSPEVGMPGSPLGTESTRKTLEIGREAEGLQRYLSMEQTQWWASSGAFAGTDSLPLGGRTADRLAYRMLTGLSLGLFPLCGQ